MSGAPLSQGYVNKIVADAGTNNAIEGVRICKEFQKNVRFKLVN